jgi:hypothetical protein
MRKEKISPSEHFDELAARHGVTVEKLKRKNLHLDKDRKSGSLLNPGDEINIPGKERQTFNRPTDVKHSFKKKSPKKKLRLQFLEEGKPRDGLSAKLSVDGEDRDLATDGEGKLEVEIEAITTSAILILETEVGPEEYHLQIGDKDPISTDRGLQTRLSNLGFYGGNIDGDLGPVTNEALACFQYFHELYDSVGFDSKSRDKIESEYGC